MPDSVVVSLGEAVVLQRLPVPRPVQLRDGGVPAVLLGWVTDGHGRRLWAEIITYSSFVRPDALGEEAGDVA